MKRIIIFIIGAFWLLVNLAIDILYKILIPIAAVLAIVWTVAWGLSKLIP